jgi:hypothetical protein
MQDDAVNPGAVVEGVVVAPAQAPVPRPGSPFVPGDPRINRAGRKEKSKALLGRKMVADLSKWHAKHGYKAIEKVGREKPEILLQIIAGLIPREDRLELEHTGGVAVGVIDIQEIKQRTRDLLARIGDADDTRPGAG